MQSLGTLSYREKPPGGRYSTTGNPGAFCALSMAIVKAAGAKSVLNGGQNEKTPRTQGVKELGA